MVIWILVGLAVVVVGLVAFVASRPDAFELSRSAVIGAPAPVVFEQVNNFRQWEHWSPWAKVDPNMTLTISGPDGGAGTGASYHWVGNKKVGEGRMTILESDPAQRVKIDLNFLKPFACRHIAAFQFEPAGAGATRVTWSMSGKSSFVLKAMGLFCSMDKMVGKDFEKGLAQMKAVAEGQGRSEPLKEAVGV